MPFHHPPAMALGFRCRSCVCNAMPSRSVRTGVVRLTIGVLLWFFYSSSLSSTPDPKPASDSTDSTPTIRTGSKSSSPTKLDMRIRPATPADLDAITALGLAALHEDPIWPYRFPQAKAFPDHHYKFSRIRFSEYLDSVKAGVYQSMVVEVPSMEDPAVAKVIAFSMWSLPTSWRPPTSGAYSC